VCAAAADRYALLAAFAEDVRGRLDAVESWLAAAAEADGAARLERLLPELGDAAHSLRGGAATGGLRRIAALAVELDEHVQRASVGDHDARGTLTALVQRLVAPLRSLSGSPLGTSGPAGPLPIVLHVEDNLSNLTLVEQILSRRGDLVLVEARTGDAGLILAEDLLPALVLLDRRLPDLTGEDVLRRLRESSAAAGLRVVLVSADARPAEADRLLAAGAHAYLVKPFDVAALDRHVDDAVRAVS
jgi:CheY-like chemotaxis protein